MTEQTPDTEILKALLLKHRKELLDVEASADEASATVELDQTRVGRLSRMDAMQAQAMSVATRQRRKLELKNIETTLKRIEIDDFGYCSECGEMINPKRLLSNPTVTLCIECASAAEL